MENSEIKRAYDTFWKLAKQHYHYYCTLPRLGYKGRCREDNQACWSLLGLEIRR